MTFVEELTHEKNNNFISSPLLGLLLTLNLIFNVTKYTCSKILPLFYTNIKLKSMYESHSMVDVLVFELKWMFTLEPAAQAAGSTNARKAHYCIY